MRFNISIIVLSISAVSGVVGLPLAERKLQSSEITKTSEDGQLAKRSPVKYLLLLWATVTLVGGTNQREWFSRLGLDWKPEDGAVVKRDIAEEVVEGDQTEKMRQTMLERDKEFLRALMEMDQENFQSEQFDDAGI